MSESLVSSRWRLVVNAFTAALALIAVSLLILSFVQTSVVVDIALRSLTFLGVVATAAFGVLGRLTDFADKDTKKITAWGYTSLWGAAVSFLISTLSFTAGVYQDSAKAAKEAAAALVAAEDAQRTAEQNAEMLRLIRREVNRFDGLFVDFSLQFSHTFPQEYYAAIRQRDGAPGVVAPPDRTQKIVSGCAEGFPGMGVPEVDIAFTALREIDVVVVIGTREHIESALGSLRRSGESGPLTAEIVDSAFRGSEWRGITGRNSVSAATISAECDAMFNPGVYLSLGSDDFIGVRSPVADTSTWRSDGSVISAVDFGLPVHFGLTPLPGGKDAPESKMAIVWSSVFSSVAIPDDYGLPGPTHVSLGFPPVGIACFILEGGQGGLKVEPIGASDMVAVLDFALADDRQNDFC